MKRTKRRTRSQKEREFHQWRLRTRRKSGRGRSLGVNSILLLLSNQNPGVNSVR